MEIERKFLVSVMPAELPLCRRVDITQAYLNTDIGGERRIRRMADSSDESFFLTEKSGSGMIRTEVEREISREEYNALLPLAVTAPIIKTRHFIPLANSLTAELDVYGGSLSGLSVVEVEFDSADSAISFVPPEWFGREVTDDKGFKNSALALIGLPNA